MATAIAALINGRARKVTPAVVRALQHALPGSTILVSGDFDQARRHVRELIKQRPEVVLSGGGDGAAMLLLNFWREEGGEALPTLGILRLGTGNGWARALGAPKFFPHLKQLSLLREPLPVQEFTLVEVEKHLCHFAGVGWDATILNDYQRNLDKRSSQLVGSRLASWLNKGARGYLYSALRITVPEEWRRLRKYGQPRVALENLGPEVFGLSETGAPVLISGATQLYEGPVSVGAAATVPEWGYGFRAFPHAGKKPGFINLRIYDRPVLDALRSAAKLWHGAQTPGLHDWFATAVRMRFSRPMPFQIGGDAMGEREEIVLRGARETVRVVDWRTALSA
jgi:diacylglycerol kinase family enzyme